MGVCASQQDRVSKTRSHVIDWQLKEDSKRCQRDCKVLVLGSAESGKSTIMRQMRIISHGGFSKDELLAFRPTIHKNAVDSAQAVVGALREFGLEEVLVDEHRHLPEVIDSARALTGETADAIEMLWQDPVVSRLLDEHGSEFHLMDSAPYFITHIQRLAKPGYSPTVEDVLRARTQSTSMTEMRFNAGNLSIHIFDVGGHRTAPRKWLHCFESVASIIFCAALSDYDQVLPGTDADGEETTTQNRLRESLVLFENIINSRWFIRTSIILFLNKVDVFQKKLTKIPLERHFPEFVPGGLGNAAAAKYILWCLIRQNCVRQSVYPYLTQATDTDNIRTVFGQVRETILPGALRNSNIL
ncbi:guanine nucleotide binding protein, alpha subunit [Mycena amicta]|nr:guanine nucleotide binding protein, alpha subunit [Mycena amicta]